MQNANGVNGYQILPIYSDLLVYFMKKYKPENIHHINNFNQTILVVYLLNDKLDHEIMKELSDMGCSLLEPKNINSLSNILNKNCNKLDIIKKYFKFDVKIF